MISDEQYHYEYQNMKAFNDIHAPDSKQYKQRETASDSIISANSYTDIRDIVHVTSACGDIVEDKKPKYM